jgi:AsmA protein
MLRACVKRLGRWILASVAIPILLWAGVVTLLPTGWLRARIVAELAQRTGHEVQLAEVAVGPLGGLRLKGLEIRRPGAGVRPWLRVPELRIDVERRALVSGRVLARVVHATGVELRAERQEGRGFDFCDLVRCPNPEQSDSQREENGEADDEQEVRVVLTDARVLIRDAPTGTNLDLLDIHGTASWRPSQATLHQLSGRVNGGTFQAEAEVQRGALAPMFEAQVVARDARLGEGMELLAYLVPVLSGSSSELDGQLDLNLYLRGQGDEAEELSRSLVGQGALEIDPIHLRDTPLVSELRRTLKLADSRDLGAIRTDFAVAGGRVLTSDMTLEFAGVPLVLSGCTDFQGRVDYRVKADSLAEALGPELKDLLGELPRGLEELVEVRIQGTPRKLSLSLDGVPVNREGPAGPSQEEEWKQLARRLRDRLLR